MDGVETPEFLNDEQMHNYVSSLLLKVMHDCEPLLTVSTIQVREQRGGVSLYTLYYECKAGKGLRKLFRSRKS